VAGLTQLDRAEAARIAEELGLVLEEIVAQPERGTVNSGFLLRASGRRWFLRVNEGKGEESVRAEAALVERLAAGGVPTPVPRRARSGEVFVRLTVGAEVKAVSCFPWLDGREARAVDDAEVAGEALGLLHRAGAGMRADELPPNLYSLAALEQRLAAVRAAPKVAASEAARAAVPLVAEELARAAGRAGAAGLIHQDLFPDNLLLDEKGALVAVLDFEQATHGRLGYDLAVTLCAFAWDEARAAPDGAAGRALVRAYERARGAGALSSEERAGLADEVRLAAARFTLTRITDIFLRDGVEPDLAARKDFRRYAERLVWARGDRALGGWLG
jgi:homoserine kinase type II